MIVIDVNAVAPAIERERAKVTRQIQRRVSEASPEPASLTSRIEGSRALMARKRKVPYLCGVRCTAYVVRCE